MVQAWQYDALEDELPAVFRLEALGRCGQIASSIKELSIILDQFIVVNSG